LADAKSPTEKIDPQALALMIAKDNLERLHRVVKGAINDVPKEVKTYEEAMHTLSLLFGSFKALDEILPSMMRDLGNKKGDDWAAKIIIAARDLVGAERFVSVGTEPWMGSYRRLKEAVEGHFNGKNHA